MPKDIRGQEILGAVEIVIGEVMNYYVPGSGSWLVRLGIATMVAGAVEEVLNQLSPNGPSAAASKILVRSTTASLPVIYGQVKTGGVMCFYDTYGSNNQNLCLGVALGLATTNGSSSLGVSSIQDLWLDNIQIPAANITDGVGISAGGGGSAWNSLVGNVIFTRYDGSQSTADATLTANFASYWVSTAVGKGIPWVLCNFYRDPNDDTFQAAFPRGAPQAVMALVNGQKVYDPRLDSTNGGSGSQRLATPSTWTYSNNPALCAADYLTRSILDGGWGQPQSAISWPSVAAAANVCDTTFTAPGGTLTPYFSCNVALDTAASLDRNLQIILDSMAGVVMPCASDGLLYIYAGAYNSPTDTFDESYLAGASAVMAAPPNTGLYNAVKATYEDPLQDFQVIEAMPATNSGYETDDGGRRIWQQLSLPAVNNPYQAQYLEAIRLAQSRNKQQFTAHCNFKAIQWKGWDTVTVNLAEYGVSGGVYRITSWTLNADKTVDVIIKQEASTTYNIPTFTTVTPPAGITMVRETPPVPTGLTAFGVADGIEITWNLPQGFYNITCVERSPDNSSWAEIVRTRAGFYHDPLKLGEQRYYRLRTRNYTNFSAYTSSVTALARYGMDYTANNVNLMTLAYSLFNLNGLQPSLGVVGITVGTGGTSIYGYPTLLLTFSGSGSTLISLHPSGSTLTNLSLKARKYIVSCNVRVGTSNNDTFNFVFGFYNSSGTLIAATGTVVPTTDHAANTNGVYYGVLDLTAASTFDGFIRLTWNTAPAAGTGSIQGVQVELQNGNNDYPSPYTVPTYSVLDASGSTGGTSGSTPPSVPNLNFTYNNATANQIIWSWPAFNLLRSDSSTTAISSGSLTTTGLTNPTTYRSYPEFDEILLAVKFVGQNTGDPSGSGNTHIMFASGGSATAAQAMSLLGRCPLSAAGMSCTTTGGGGGGGSGGGIGSCLHPKTPVETANRGWMDASDLRAGDRVFTRDGRDKPIRRAWREAGEGRWARIEFGAHEQPLVCTHNEPLYQPDGSMIRAGELRLGTIVSAGGRHLEVEALAIERDEEQRVCLDVGGDCRFLAWKNGPEIHNTTQKL